jgi:hypothetical protein
MSSLTPGQRDRLDFLKRRMSWYAYGTGEYETCRRAFAKFCLEIRGQQAQRPKGEPMTFPRRSLPEVVQRYDPLITFHD